MTNQNSRRPGGFTLVELLVSITIIVVLASLVFTLSSRAINSAQKSVCMSNLRGVGSALQGYILEHSGRLPGPLNTGQSALNNGSSRSLVTYIAPYMEAERDKSAGPYLVANYGCPSLMKHIKVNTVANPPIVYRLEEKGTLLDNLGRNITYPWGYSAGVIPKRLDEINPISANKVWAMIEQDQSMGGSWSNNGAVESAHGNQRIALYWDFSVRGVNLSEWK